MATAPKRRLIDLRDACDRIGISTRNYHRDPSQLPLPVRKTGKPGQPIPKTAKLRFAEA